MEPLADLGLGHGSPFEHRHHDHKFGQTEIEFGKARRHIVIQQTGQALDHPPQAAGSHGSGIIADCHASQLD